MKKVDTNKKSTKQKTPVTEDTPLTQKLKLFCDEYIQTGNGEQSAIKAGYSAKTARITASKILTRANVKKYLRELRQQQAKEGIASSEEVLQFFTRAMNGEIKDQFGLEASLGDRIQAGRELAKRTVDIDNRANGKPDSVVKIELDWDRGSTEGDWK